MAVSIDITITQNSQNKTNNTSNVTVKVAAKWTYTSYNLNKQSGSCTINGTKYTFTSAFNTGKTTSGSGTIYTKTLDIKHNSDGKKTLSVSASYVSGVSSGTVTDSASKTLTTIQQSTPEEPARPILQSVSTTSSEITWYLYNFSALSENSRKFRFFLTDPAGSLIVSEAIVNRPAGTTDVIYTYRGLMPSTTYKLEVKMNGVTPSGSDVSTIHTYNNTATTQAESTTLNFLTSPSIDSIWAYAYGINKSSIQRRIRFTADGQEFFADYITANVTPPTYSYYYYGVEEGKSYNIEVSVLNNSTGAVMYLRNEIVKIPWDRAMSISTTNVGETTITTQAYGLNGNKNYARSIKWYIKGLKDSDYVWETTTQINANTSNTTFTYPKSNLRANTTYGIKVELIKDSEVLKTLTTTANTLEVAGSLEVENIGDTSVTLFLTGMSGAIGRTIKWFYKKATDTEYILAGETAMTSSASSVSKVVTGLVNETAYNFKAEVYDTTDTDYIIGLKTATATTQKQVAVMSLGTATSASLRVNLSEMEANVNYDKYIYWYIKRETDATFIESGVDVIRNGEVSFVSRLFTGLISSTINSDGTLAEAKYNVRAVIKKNDVTTMATITNTYATTLKDSDIPSPTIIEVLQIIGEKKAELWWEAPEHIQSSETYVHYDIELSTDGSTFIKIETVDTPPEEYTVITFDAFDVDYYARIKTYPNATSEEKKYSNVVKVRMTEDFDWETVVQGGECIIRADKWNLIVRYIRKRLADKNIVTPIVFTHARIGRSITADMFNELLVCNTFYDTGIAKKQSGDAIRAEDLLMLQTAVNFKEV